MHFLALSLSPYALRWLGLTRLLILSSHQFPNRDTLTTGYLLLTTAADAFFPRLSFLLFLSSTVTDLTATDEQRRKAERADSRTWTRHWSAKSWSSPKRATARDRSMRERRRNVEWKKKLRLTREHMARVITYRNSAVRRCNFRDRCRIAEHLHSPMPGVHLSRARIRRFRVR